MGFYGLGVQIFIQLVSVPLFTAHWGVEGYGVWLILFSAPSLLSMADFGLTTAGANAMVSAVAQGDRDQAARIYHALRHLTVWFGSVLLGIASLILLLTPSALFSIGGGGESAAVRDAAWVLAFYGVLPLFNGVTLAGFRAADAFAASGAIYQTVVLFEAICAFVVVGLGGTIVGVAMAYLSARMVGTATLAMLLKSRVPWLQRRGLGVDFREVRSLFAPAIAAFVLPISNIITYNGSLIAIGAVSGPAAIPAFSVVRTITRIALQFAMRLNIASMPRFTVAFAQGSRDRVAALVLLNYIVVMLLVVPAAVALGFFGQAVVTIWTSGHVDVQLSVLLVLVGAMVVNAGWAPMANLLLAINHQASFSYAALAFSSIAVLVGTALLGNVGVLGMAFAMLGLELMLVWWVWRKASMRGLGASAFSIRDLTILIKSAYKGIF